MDGTVAKPARNNEEAIKMVEECNAQGAELIKLMITGGILDTKEKGVIGLLKMDPSMIKACTTKTHELGLKVAAHVEGQEGVKEAILNGVDTIEHGAKVSDELVDLFKNHGGAYVATFSPAMPLAMLDPKPLGYDDIHEFYPIFRNVNSVRTDTEQIVHFACDLIIDKVTKEKNINEYFSQMFPTYLHIIKE